MGVALIGHDGFGADQAAGNFTAANTDGSAGLEFLPSGR